jgi:hypothetical protein
MRSKRPWGYRNNKQGSLTDSPVPSVEMSPEMDIVGIFVAVLEFLLLVGCMRLRPQATQL